MNIEIRDWIFVAPFCIHLFSYSRFYIVLERKDIKLMNIKLYNVLRFAKLNYELNLTLYN